MQINKYSGVTYYIAAFLTAILLMIISYLSMKVHFVFIYAYVPYKDILQSQENVRNLLPPLKLITLHSSRDA